MMVNEIVNNYARGTDQYPKTIMEAYNLLITYQKPINQSIRTPKQQVAPGITPSQTKSKVENESLQENQKQLEELSFAQRPAPTTMPSSHPHIECLKCHQMGHYASSCPSRETNDHPIKTGTQFYKCTVMIPV